MFYIPLFGKHNTEPGISVGLSAVGKFFFDVGFNQVLETMQLLDVEAGDSNKSAVLDFDGRDLGKQAVK